MTTDIHGQGIIDFSKMFGEHQAKSKGRNRIPPSLAVPEQEVHALETVRIKSRLSHRDISIAMGLTDNERGSGFVNRVLSGRQRVSREDFTQIFIAVAQLVFKMIRDA